MAIPFTQIPTNLRVPLFWVEVDNSAANPGGGGKPKSLLVGLKLAAGSATADVPVQVTSKALASDLFGFGSDLHRMCLRAFEADPFGELWALPIAEATGTNASATLQVVAASGAESDGTVHLYLGGRKVAVSVSEGDSAGDIRDAILSAISDSDEPLGITASTHAVDEFIVTYVHDGTTGNSFDIRANYAGRAGGEAYPSGVTVELGGNDIDGTPGTLSGGATDPSLSTAITNMGDEPFDYIASSWAGTTELDAFETELADRWGALKQTYGHVWSALRDTQGNLSTAIGDGARNDPHMSVVGYDKIPTVSCELAAGAMAACARELKIDPARPLQSVALRGFLLPTISDAFTVTQQDSLLNDGVATLYRGGGKLRITRMVTTYQQNDAGDPDVSYLDVTTLATLQYVLRALRNRITSKFPRHKLVNDGTSFATGAAVVSPSTIRAELVAQYIELERAALVENREAFKTNLVVERDDTDPNRVNVLYPPDLVNGLRVLAVLAQFRLQYASTEEG
jgi:phage tail sheath gpL-like